MVGFRIKAFFVFTGEVMQIIYGGSFNPPTLAHFLIAQFIMDKFPNDDFVFLPTNNFYEKNNLKDFRIRLKLLRILCKKLGAKAKISDFELKLDRYYGTAYTLSHFPDSWFVIGADNLQTIHTWINYPNVIQKYHFLVVPRNDIDIEAIFQSNPELSENRKNFTILADFKEVYISSSEYRKTQDSRYLLPEVAEYIVKNQLYKE